MPWWPKAQKMEEGKENPEQSTSAGATDKKKKEKKKKQSWGEAKAEMSKDFTTATNNFMDLFPAAFEKGISLMGRASIGFAEESMKTFSSDLKESVLKPKDDTFKNYEGQVAVITGGGGSIGRAMAREFLAHRMKVLLSDCDANRLENAAAVLNGEGHPGELKTMICDITSEKAVEEMADTAFGMGKVRVLACNAGVSVGRSQLDSQKIFQFVFETNVMGTQRCLRLFVNRMANQEDMAEPDQPRVIVTSNNAGLYSHTQGAFGAASAAVVSMTESLQAECTRRKANILVHLLLTGVVDTAVLQNSADLYSLWAGESVTEEDQKAAERMTSDVYSIGLPPEEVANAVINGLRRNYMFISSHQVATRMAVADHFAGLTRNERRLPLKFGDYSFKDPDDIRRKSELTDKNKQVGYHGYAKRKSQGGGSTPKGDGSETARPSTANSFSSAGSNGRPSSAPGKRADSTAGPSVLEFKRDSDAPAPKEAFVIEESDPIKTESAPATTEAPPAAEESVSLE